MFFSQAPALGTDLERSPQCAPLPLPARVFAMAGTAQPQKLGSPVPSGV